MAALAAEDELQYARYSFIPCVLRLVYCGQSGHIYSYCSTRAAVYKGLKSISCTSAAPQQALMCRNLSPFIRSHFFIIYLVPLIPQVLVLTFTYIVGCRGVVQLGGLIPGYPWEVPLRLRLGSLFTEVSLKVEIKSTCFILLSHFIVQAVTKIVTGCLGAMKSCHICIR